MAVPPSLRFLQRNLVICVIHFDASVGCGDVGQHGHAVLVRGGMIRIFGSAANVRNRASSDSPGFPKIPPIRTAFGFTQTVAPSIGWPKRVFAVSSSVAVASVRTSIFVVGASSENAWGRANPGTFFYLPAVRCEKSPPLCEQNPSPCTITSRPPGGTDSKRNVPSAAIVR